MCGVCCVVCVCVCACVFSGRKKCEASEILSRDGAFAMLNIGIKRAMAERKPKSIEAEYQGTMQVLLRTGWEARAEQSRWWAGDAYSKHPNARKSWFDR